MAAIVTPSTDIPGDLVVVADAGGSHRIKLTEAAALRAHFEAEKDTDLGRWRDPSAPTYVAYPSGREVAIVSETTGSWGQWSEHHARLEASRDKLAAVAVRYFEAHDPRFQAVREAIWESLEPRLEDVINLDLNVPAQNEQFAALVTAAARAVIEAGRE